MSKSPKAGGNKKAFFDTAESGESSFWFKKEATHFKNKEGMIEDNFYIREESHGQWLNCTLAIYKSYLICKRRKSDEMYDFICMDEHFYKMEPVTIKRKKDNKELNGFMITRNGNFLEIMCNEESVYEKWLAIFTQQCVLTDFYEKYKVLNLLGKGGYGKVLQLEEIATGEKWAGKFIKLEPAKNREKQQVMVANEIKMLRRCNHPNIVKLKAVFELNDEICIVMELVNGSRIFDEIVKTRGLSERETAIIMKQLFSILSHLQIKDIIHRDLKPENVLFSRNKHGQIKIKLIDFGLATLHSKRDVIKRGGTAGYAAPEVLNGDPYDFKADMFSVGVIMYTCLTGKPLFYAITYQELLDRNRKGVTKFGGRAWTRISARGKELLTKLLETSPFGRYSLDKAIDHPWLADELSIQERAELLESTLKFTQMDIPKEIKSSGLNQSVGIIPVFDNRRTRMSNSDLMLSQNTFASFSGLNSVYIGESQASNLNSFYKIVSVNSSWSDRSDKRDCDSETQNTEFKSNVLILPNKKYVGARHGVSQSLNSLNQNENLKFNVGYNIHIQVIESNPDFDVVPDDDEEDNPCSKNVDQLHRNRLFFENPSATKRFSRKRSEIKKRSMEEPKTQKPRVLINK